MILIMTYKWCQRKGFSLPKLFHKKSEKKMPSNSIREPDSTLTDIKIPTISRNGDLQLKVTENSLNGGDTVVDSPTTMTTTISRRGAPSESRGFDYTYDNPAMSTQGTQGSRDTEF
ncbi:uncharacterized protein LOC123305613 [Chrysoperla carnea]|uniref:uncharacterized protein LOC123305613 n=1 Tax=Chrysoperla carnea TaxID=189513 RepID=UPI001D083BF6|nr:uncharacterized protein LOC123305613 [Chrysoperla carnea]